MIAPTARIFMDELLHWTLVASCSRCAHESTVTLYIGVVAVCEQCGARITIDPASTVFHRASAVR